MSALNTMLNAARIALYAKRPDLAFNSLQLALGLANQYSPPHRRPIMRAMNWLRAAQHKAP